MLEALLASILIAILSLGGVLVFRKSGYLTGTHRFVLPVAVGVFLGVVFFELVPETLEASHEWGPLVILGGFLAFYFLSFLLDTYHHHHFDAGDQCATGGVQRLLIGDTIHNFADGIVVASAFMVNPTVGVLTTIGVALHEIPQEIAEYGVLIASGCTRARAALYNFLSAMSIIAGVLITYFVAEVMGEYVYIFTGIAAGNLLYIATADLIPELRDSHRNHFFSTFIATLIGAALIIGTIYYAHGLGE